MRRITQQYGALLIFDEVMTGFRLARGGAQQLFNIKPDLTTLGKIIGGGLPIAAYGGRADIMNKVAPVGPVYQAGTLSGNPLAVSAGIAMLTHIEEHPETYDILEQRTAALTANPPAGMIGEPGRLDGHILFPSRAGAQCRRCAPLRHRASSVNFFITCSSATSTFRPPNTKRFSFRRVHSPADIEHTVQAIREFSAQPKPRVLVTGAAKRIGRIDCDRTLARGFACGDSLQRLPCRSRRSFAGLRRRAHISSRSGEGLRNPSAFF